MSLPRSRLASVRKQLDRAYSDGPIKMVVVDHLSKQFGGQPVLADISLNVEVGQVVVMIGPSGAGKSTLLRCINYLERPDAGRIVVDGKVLDAGRRPARRELLERRRTVGMVFQSFNLFTHMSVLRNVSLAQQRVLGRTRAQADARSRELLERVGLGHKIDARPLQCSGGEQQRVAIARALALDPKVLLLDEPTSALDPELGYEVLRVMRELATSGMTMVVSTHEMRFAEDVADRVIVLANGRIVEDGLPKEVIYHPQQPRTREFLRAILER